MRITVRYLLIILLFPLPGILPAQVNNQYLSEWKKVDDFTNKGLTKSALDEVNKIFLLAKKNNNEPQQIKSLVYKITLNQNITEDAIPKNIDTIEHEIAFSHGSAKAILQSIAAEMYWNYFQQQRWKIYNRTKTTNFNKKDINTWGADDFHNKISDLYLESISNEDLLKRTGLDEFDVIIIKGNSRHLRPTLFDLLAHRALSYFKSDERDINRPAYAFEIKDEKAFAPAREFMTHKFVNRDSASLHYKALKLFQQLLAFHINDAKPAAFIDVDIERIQFAKQYGVMKDVDEKYSEALDHLTKNSSDTSTAQAGYLIAQLIFDKATANKDTGKYTFVMAKDRAQAVADRYPGSEGGINARNLLQQIHHESINLTTEKVNIPGKPFRTLVSYKNISSISLRVIVVTPELKKLLERNNSENSPWDKLRSQKYIRSWKQPLPVINDYRDHSVEIKIDALPIGQYALLVSTSDSFNFDNKPLAVQYFYISSISYVNKGREYFVLDRESGQPLAGTEVQVWQREYDYSTSKNKLTKRELLTSDETGYFLLSPAGKGQQYNFLLEFNYREDRLFMDDAGYNYNNSTQTNEFKNQQAYDEQHAKIFLFTDRSIYRPGQLVYFKGIGVTQDYKTKKNKLLSSKDSIVLYLNDANDKQVDSIKVALNEYGSINGKFRLPGNKLNGEFNITVDSYENSSVSFSVEEYKRPQFYAEFEKVKGTYHVNDTIKVTGFAKAYAGNNIDGAKVKYRVTRQARFLYSWMFWWRPMPSIQPLEIVSGDTTTGTDGKFTILFTAIPDLSVDKNTDPLFDYKIEADITDITGETRSTSTTVPVGYKALNIQLSLPSSAAMPADSFKYLFASTKNLSDEFERSLVHINIYKLQTPIRLIRTRLWAQPDQFIMNKQQFLNYFPHDEYDNELKKENWRKEKLIYSVTDSSSPNSKFDIVSALFKQGWYVAEATSTDKYGQEVKDVKYFELYDMAAPSLPMPAYNWSTILKNVTEPGEDASFIGGTSADHIFVIQQVQREEEDEDKIIKNFHFFNLNNEKKNFTFPVHENMRGGFSIFQFFVKDNRLFTNTWNVSVPWTNKELSISFDTYRDKTLPGSEEKWKVKVSGLKGEKTAAEMLAGMYDASLDQFKEHSWSSLSSIWPEHYGYNRWNGAQSFNDVRSQEKYTSYTYFNVPPRTYDELMFGNFSYRNNRVYKSLEGRISGVDVQRSMSAPMANQSLSEVVVTGLGTTRESKELGYSTSNIILRGSTTLAENPGALIVVDGVIYKGDIKDLNPSELLNISVLKGAEATALYGAQAAKGVLIITTKSGSKPKEDLTNIQTRKNFNETAFFYPELHTDKEGNIEFSFTMPEALTQWKMMTLAHTKDLASGYAEKTVVTQKELMIQPFAPRFLREGDKMEFTAKVVNLGTKEINGDAQLQLLNASTMLPVDGWFKNTQPYKSYTIAAGQSTLVSFTIDIPYNYNNAVVYRIVAKAGDASDGEEAAIPVLTNRMLVTETMPLPVRGFTTKNFTFDKLLNSGKSSTLTNFALTTEYTTNPAWYAVQALPYLMEFPYECAEQTFNRYYANSIASKIVKNAPAIKAVFEKWKITDTAALLSNLQKNEELKSVLLQETPWVLEAENESKQKKNMALLFDILRMSNELESSLTKLSDMQSSNGGFVWFKGGRDDRYITQYIVTGIGHLQKLGAVFSGHEIRLDAILKAAIPYLDKKLKEDYENLIKYKVKLDQDNTGYMSIHYLYMRSFFPDYPVAKESQTAYTYFRENAKKFWLSTGKYSQAMIALALYRTNDKLTPVAILKSLQENSINNEETGMYWKEWNNGGYYWYQAPIESQAMMIEAFSEIGKDAKVVDDLKTWLLKNKQTNNWHTTKATAEACYALLLQGTDWLTEEKNVTIKLGNTTINSKDENQEAGTGYFKTKIDGSRVTPDMGNISVTVSAPGTPTSTTAPSWGAVYWQYFENLDKITFSETPLKLNKKLFIEKNTDRGPVLTSIEEGTEVKVGDKIKVRIELRVDREMEYVHMKDMRASCMEPVNVLSEYKYQDGLGYYETTKDASTNFFFSWLPKGTYVFEYPMFVTHSGNFSNGITSIQCMYAPEFTAHSEGVRVNVSK